MQAATRRPSLRLVAVFSLLCCATAHGADPVPTVSLVNPQAVAPGSGSFTLKVYGSGFVAGAVVNWNGSERATTILSGRLAVATIPSSDVGHPGAGIITVTNPNGRTSSASSGLVEVGRATTGFSLNKPNFYGGRNDAIVHAITADFNGDGNLDIVESGSNSFLSVALGGGDGTFKRSAKFKTQGPASLAYGDFNNDGKLDFVFMSSHVRFMEGSGHGTFTAGQNTANFPNPGDIVVADFNGDGNLDLAISNAQADTVSIILGAGNGTFHTQTDYRMLNSPSDLVTGDFDGDGNLDLAVINGVKGGGRAISVFLGQGNGNFLPPQTVSSVNETNGGSARRLFIADFNGDSWLDLAVGERGGISVLMGNGDGTFQSPVHYGSGFVDRQQFTFAVGDFNCDGNTDLVTSAVSNGHFALLEGNSDGTFKSAVLVNLPDHFSGPNGIVVGDLNSDGLLDFILQPGPSGIAVYTQ